MFPHSFLLVRGFFLEGYRTGGAVRRACRAGARLYALGRGICPRGRRVVPAAVHRQGRRRGYLRLRGHFPRGRSDPGRKGPCAGQLQLRGLLRGARAAAEAAVGFRTVYGLVRLGQAVQAGQRGEGIRWHAHRLRRRRGDDRGRRGHTYIPEKRGRAGAASRRVFKGGISKT